MGLTHAIARCRRGDASAFAEVVAAHADRLTAMLYRLLGNLEDARDVAQETFVRAHANLHRYDSRRPFEPWLYRIGRNLAYNHLDAAGRRLEGRVGRASDEQLAGVSSGESPDRAADRDERRDRVSEVLAAMRPQYREALTLRYMMHLEYGDIAERMGVPIGTVRTWLNRAKKEFRQSVEGKEWF